jgi:hypothetical protein
MPAANPGQASFNAGELSPILAGRVDVAYYANGVSRMRNFLPLIQGPARRREGTRFVAETKSNGKVWLARFVFDFQNAYILEFGEFYIRFFNNRGQVLNLGNPYEIVSPYSLADLTDTDGTFRLSMVQSGDVIYMAHPNHPPKKLQRFGHTNWTIVDYAPIGGPFNDQNLNESITVHASAMTGTVTLTASQPIFGSDRVGSLFYIQPKDLSGIDPWEPRTKVTVGERRRSDGKTYLETNANVSPPRFTGAVTPTHERGIVRDGADQVIIDPENPTPTPVTAGILWLFEDIGYGVAKITAVAGDNLSATATVQIPQIGGVANLPFSVVGAGKTTWRWAYGSWSVGEGFPSAVTFFRERLTFAKDQRLFFSAPGSFDDMAAQRVVGESNADNAIVALVASDRNDTIKWISPQDSLIAATTGGELVCGEMSQQQVFGPGNVKITSQTAYGASGVDPVRVSTASLFFERSRRRLREINYNYESDNYIAPDLTVRAEHITSPGIVDMTFAQSPDSIVFAARQDGALVGFTYEKPQDVLAWHLHPIGGVSDAAALQGAVVEAVESIPSPDGTRDDLWMVVRRRINGLTKRYVEFLTEPVAIPEQAVGETGDAYVATRRYYQAKQFFVDSGLSLDAPITITGATQVNPVVIAATGHGLVTGDKVRIDLVTGMWQLNGKVYTVTNLTANTFSLDGINGTAFGAYQSGGQVRKLVTTVSNLGHLEGQTVQVLVDGATHPNRVVTGGAITLQQPAAIVHVGLGYRSVLRTMRLEAGAAKGVAQGKTKRITRMGIRLHESLGGKLGPDESKLDPILYRTSNNIMGFAPPLFTGDELILWPDGYNTDAFVTVVQDQPLPMTVCAIWPEMETYER